MNSAGWISLMRKPTKAERKEKVQAKRSQRTGRLNINTYTYKNKKLKNRKLKRKRKQKRKRGSLREGREAPPRRCPHPFRFCFRFRFNFRFFKFLFLYVYVLIFNCPVLRDSIKIKEFSRPMFSPMTSGE